ncbi:subtilisin-like protein [Apiospora arundinis]|uniref:Subtilisin-like protein n=1 Tax=Apiospora arundinis TaxID=335852 RepID=A0ABR2JG72_9PEZI
MAPTPSDESIAPVGEEPLEFAQDAFGRISMLAADIGFKERSATAGCLAAELWIAKKTIESADEAHSAKLERRSLKLMRHLERICCWPNTPAHGSQSILRNLVRPNTQREAHKAEARARLGLSKFFHGPDFVKQDWFRQLERFSKDSQTRAATNDRNASQAIKKTPNEYPREINATLYNVFRYHSACVCVATQQPSRKHGRHAARLRLRADIVSLNEGFGFDILIHSLPVINGHWQDVQLRVKQKRQKSVRYDGETTKTHDEEPSRLLEPGSLCNLVNTRVESRLNLQIQNSQLYQLYEGIPIQQRIRPEPSLPLKRVLDTYRLSNKMKLVLCYIIARSVWQYYDSPWADTWWSNESIHFLFESSTTSPSEGSLYASKPYFAIAFGDVDDCLQEYCDSFSVIFRYPRILALCMMLLEIMRGRAFELDKYDTVEASVNARWDLAFRTVEDPSQWINFEYTDFRSALRKSLMSKTFDEASTRTGSGSNDLKHDLDHRRKILFDVLIEPLHRLLSLLGFEDVLDHIEPMSPREHSRYIPGSPSVPRIPIQSASATSVEEKEKEAANNWIERIGQLNTHVCNSVMPTPLRSHIRPIRVAVLDSGYDEESSFFQAPLRSRKVKGWRDFVGDSADPVDENGHGTHTVALVMKMAPSAEVYVARIARDRGAMGQAPHAICQAIKWATEECDVDIVSMSFGFESEIPEISIAIREAELRKHDKLLFFAAASNSGGNRREMFPACHDAVISIRQTNAHGSFSDTNPPADPYGPAVFGTLGSNVPSAWLVAATIAARSGKALDTPRHTFYVCEDVGRYWAC